MNNIPQKIWLNVGLNNNDEKVEDFKELSEVTWSEEKIFDRDIPFERAINKNNLWHSIADGDLPPVNIDCLFVYATIIDKGFMRADKTIHVDAEFAPLLDIEDVDYWMEIPQLPKKEDK
jgi:hypothetical protein